MPDVAGFRRALATLTRLERETLDARCDGVSVRDLATYAQVGEYAIYSRMRGIREKMRGGMLDEERIKGPQLTEAICYRLGYEQALADIEARMAKRRAA